MKMLGIFLKQYWLPVALSCLGLALGVIGIIIVHTRNSDTSQQERIAKLEEALADALDRAEKLAAQRGGTLSTEQRENINQLKNLAKKVKRARTQEKEKKEATGRGIQKLPKGNTTAAEKQPLPQSNIDQTKTTLPNNDDRNTDGEITALDEQDLDAMQAMLEDIAKNMSDGMDVPSESDTQKQSPEQSSPEKATKDAASNESHNHGSLVIQQEKGASHAASPTAHHDAFIKNIKSAVDEKITKKQASATTARCNDIIAEKVRESIRNALGGKTS